jgi:hypothetical protein
MTEDIRVSLGLVIKVSGRKNRNTTRPTLVNCASRILMLSAEQHTLLTPTQPTL